MMFQLEICLDLASKLGVLVESDEADFRSFLTGDRPFSLKFGADQDTAGFDSDAEDDFVEEVMPEAKQLKHEVNQIDDSNEEEKPQQKVQSTVIADASKQMEKIGDD